MDREAQFIELQQRIEDLQRQSKILKLESELDGYEQMLGDASVHQPMSTPMSGKYDMPSGPGRLRFDIPPGRPDHGDSMGQGKDGSFLPDDAEPKSLTEIKVACELIKKEKSSESVTKVTENGDEIYTDKIVRKKQKVNQVNIDIGTVIPDGNVRTNDIKLQLNGEGSVELTLSYCPEESDD